MLEVKSFDMSRNELPMITFALLAYNQENYIREAVEGAFAQTYEPLEIIISDDCSSDRTFEIVKEMYQNYNGKHSVKIYRNSENYGIGKHVNSVFSKALGEIVVMAAGDDISLPDRTSAVALAARANPNAYAFCASLQVFETGKVISPNPPANVSELLNRSNWIVGAAAAYKKSTWTEFGKIYDEVRNEDEVFALRALVLGSIEKKSGPALVKYRTTTGISAASYKKYNPSLFKPINSRILINLNRLHQQWRIDLRSANMIEHFNSAWGVRVRNSYLISLTSGRGIKAKLAILHYLEFGFKSTLYFYFGCRYPSLLNKYLSVRHNYISR